jgi:sugar lactone lactonase YvrE
MYIVDKGNNRVLYYPAGSTTATAVYGQAGSFTTGTVNNGGISATSLYLPLGMVLDGSGNLYVADTKNNRVLYYPSGSTTATAVYGQGGSFTSSGSTCTAAGLNHPSFLHLDSAGNLYVADASNNRVLYYPAGSTTATRVYGQGGSFTTCTANTGGISASSLATPNDVTIDSGGNVYIADTGNNRVLEYSGTSTTATTVYGQAGSFTTYGTACSATGQNGPASVKLDSSSALYVSDFFNNRVLEYLSGSTTATSVYGQGGSLTSCSSNQGGTVSATSLQTPADAVVDSAGNVYIADAGNNRIVYYPAGSTTTALRAYGQNGSLASGIANAGGISATTLDMPNGAGLSLDSNGNLYVADEGNNRVLHFQTALVTTTQPPSSTNAGSPFTVAATLEDVGSAATFTDFTGTATVTIQAGTGSSGASLTGSTSVSASAGIATFSNVAINYGGTGFILDMSSPGVGMSTTNSITVSGVLSETIQNSPSGSITINGQDQSAVTSLGILTTDTSGSNNGWNMTITSTTFSSSGGKTLSTTATTLTSVGTSCQTSCIIPVNNVVYPLTVPAAGASPPTPVKAFNAATNTGEGNTLVTFNLSTSLPDNIFTSIYTSTITIAIVSGP